MFINKLRVLKIYANNFCSVKMKHNLTECLTAFHFYLHHYTFFCLNYCICEKLDLLSLWFRGFIHEINFSVFSQVPIKCLVEIKIDVYIISNLRHECVQFLCKVLTS